MEHGAWRNEGAKYQSSKGTEGFSNQCEWSLESIKIHFYGPCLKNNKSINCPGL